MGCFQKTLAPIRTAFRDCFLPVKFVYGMQLPRYAPTFLPTPPRRHIAEIIREDFIRSLKPDVLHITSLFEGAGDDAK